MSDDLVGRLRAWSRRFEVHSPERRLMIEAATALEAKVPEPPQPTTQGITAEMVEAAMGGRKLLKWQRTVLETPPRSLGE